MATRPAMPGLKASSVYRSRPFAVLFLFSIVRTVMAQNAYTLGAKLLANGNCESGSSKPPANFTAVGKGTNNWECDSSADVVSGEYRFYAGVGATLNEWVSIEQTVTVPSGAVGVRLEGYADSFSVGDDHGRASLTALTSGNGGTGISNDTDILTFSEWTSFELSLGPFPPGVVDKVQLRLDAMWLSGPNCNVYFDDLQLRPLYSTIPSNPTAPVITAMITTPLATATTVQVATAETTGEQNATSVTAKSTPTVTTKVTATTEARPSSSASFLVWIVVAVASVVIICVLLIVVFTVIRRRKHTFVSAAVHANGLAMLPIVDSDAILNSKPSTHNTEEYIYIDARTVVGTVRDASSSEDIVYGSLGNSGQADSAVQDGSSSEDIVYGTFGEALSQAAEG